jgi:hypothetical protein
MNELIGVVDSPEEIAAAVAELRHSVSAAEITPNSILDVFDAWATALGAKETSGIPGVAFLRLWLRRSTLEPIIARELGRGALHGDWMEDGRARLRAFPVGVVGHWPAGNIEIQPLLSMTCALLGGNAALVRVPSGLRDVTQKLVETLDHSDGYGFLAKRVFMPVFDHARLDLHEAIARTVDGAMIWGGTEAVLQLRGLPFPHWARLAVFGPRISVAAVEADCLHTVRERESWCLRIARDVWQFDQQACSSPQVLFLEKKNGNSVSEFVQALKAAFESENRIHPRATIPAALTTAICQARASWLLDDVAHSGVFPRGPDWTILVGRGPDVPKPTQGRTLTILEVDDLFDSIEKLDGNVQTLGLAMADPEREAQLASLAARRGVDRIVKLGRMHVFAPPWDGVDLIRPMVRIVRHVRSTE